jgi:N utilization substance protein A
MSKVAVVAHQEDVDPVGCCVGPRGIRIQNIVIDLGGERIDIVEWNDSPAKFIANALNPAQVANIDLSEEERIANVVVLDRQLSLAIGKEGQNARLAAKLTGWRVNIKSVSAAEVEQIKQEGTISEEVEVPEEEEISSGEQEEIPAEIAEVDEMVEEGEEKEEVAIFDIKEFTAAVEKSAEREREEVGLRFAEDVMPAKTEGGKKHSKNKRGLAEKDKAAKSGRKRMLYSEDDLEE